MYIQKTTTHTTSKYQNTQEITHKTYERKFKKMK